MLTIRLLMLFGFATLLVSPGQAARMPPKAEPGATREVVEPAAIDWQPWSDAVFAQAQRERRLVLLDLEAVWCHWCHVMDETTYRDPQVGALITKHYIAVKVDQDRRPDLSRRYDEYGWPATIVFGPDGREIVKRSGYLPPDRMASLLQAIVDDPSPLRYRDQASIETYATSALLPETLRADLAQRFVKRHDFRRGGLTQDQKYMDRDTVEYALMRAAKRDTQAAQMARQTLDGALDLIDPVWGGAYQYSTHGDWKHPHFEKLLQIQAEYLRVYALAYMLRGDPAYLQGARDIHRYVTRFLLSPDGAFYVSQDADLVKGQHAGDYFALDDAGRRKRGLPAIDMHLYAREQGWMIQALTQLYSATLDPQYLSEARAAADWALRKRALPGGGFRHDASDTDGPYLEDTLAIGRGMLALYGATAERAWLFHARACAAFIRTRFAGEAGYRTAQDRGQVLKPKPQIDENIAAARFFNLLARYTGSAEYRSDAEHAMRFLVTPEVARLRSSEAGILIADVELTADPVHLTIVGAKDDAAAQELFRAALGYPAGYRRIEWWDRTEGALPNPDVRYPELPKAAAFVCTQGTCSLPLFDAKALTALARRLEQAATR